MSVNTNSRTVLIDNRTKEILVKYLGWCIDQTKDTIKDYGDLEGHVHEVLEMNQELNVLNKFLKDLG